MKMISTAVHTISLRSLCAVLGGSVAMTAMAAPTAPAPIKSGKAMAASKMESSEPVASGRTELAPTMHLSEGKSTIIRLQHAASRVAVGDANIADVILLNPREVYMLGRGVGTTNLILWQKTGDTVIADLTVSMDTNALQDGLDKLMGSKGTVKVAAAADSLMISGTVPDVVKADQALSMANAFLTRTRSTGGGQGAGPGSASLAGAANAPTEGAISPKIINMLQIAAPQQVMLEVKVAEVSKSLVDQLGASIGVSHAIGNWTYSLLSNLLTGAPSLIDHFNRRNGNFLTIDAQKRDGLIKVLAEPTIMSISGQEASFLAGGKIFIPVAQTNNNGQATITLEEKEFGIAVKFTPTVLEGGRINLKVAPEVSELNKDGIGITANGINGTAILPSFTTRRASTVVQLYDGQSFAIGGLIKNNSATNIKAVPFLGEVPVLGALFRSNDFQSDRTELVFVVTPRLVKPLPPGMEDEILPTSNYTDPNRTNRILQGRLEGGAPRAAQKQDQPAKGAAGGFDVN